jgi:glyoxylate reductase
VEVWPDSLPPPYEVLRTKTREAQGLLCLLADRIDADLIANSPHLNAISNFAVGYDNVDLDAATRRGIPVGNTPDVLTDATADLTFALLLAGARKIPEAQGAIHDGEWVAFEPAAFLGRDVYGKTVGIVGFGRIGRAVANRAQGFDMTVIHTSTRSSRGVELEELLERADFVSLHCPLTPETHHLIDAAALDRMRPTAILVNTARGPIVDQRALKTALEGNSIAGAALDVTDPEPLPKTAKQTRSSRPQTWSSLRT